MRLVLAELPGFMIGAVGHAEQLFCVPMSAYLAAAFGASQCRSRW